MSAQASPTGQVKQPERTLVAIRAELPDDLRRRFRRRVPSGVDDTRGFYRLDRLDKVIEARWRHLPDTCQKPDRARPRGTPQLHC